MSSFNRSIEAKFIIVLDWTVSFIFYSLTILCYRICLFLTKSSICFWLLVKIYYFIFRRLTNLSCYFIKLLFCKDNHSILYLDYIIKGWIELLEGEDDEVTHDSLPSYYIYVWPFFYLTVNCYIAASSYLILYWFYQLFFAIFSANYFNSLLFMINC